MVKYYYDRYTIKLVKPYLEFSSAVPFEGQTNFNTNCYPSFTFDANKGLLPSGTPTTVTSTIKPPNGYYEFSESNSDGGYKYAYKIEDNSSAIKGSSAWIKITYTSTSVSLTDAKGALVQSNIIAENGTYPTNGRHTDGYWYVRGSMANNMPTVTLSTTDNRTLYENDTLTIDGQALDTDNGNVVNVKYSIDGIVTKALVAGVSNGVTPLAFNKQLTFKNGKLFDGETSLTGDLTGGTAHQLKVWAEDDQGGKSAEQIRNFYVVPNRVPALSIDQVTPSGIIDSDKFTITGSCSDPDGNEVAVAYKINGGLSKEIYRGKDSAWNFEVSLKELVVGENAIVVEVTDSYNFKTSKTIKLNKNEVKTPILQSVARYKITPPKSTAKGVLLWIQRDIGLSIDAEISMTLNNEQEQYIAMSKTNTAPINSSIEEDEFTYEASEEKENIIVKLKLTRESTDVSDAITLISGVLS